MSEIRANSYILAVRKMQFSSYIFTFQDHMICIMFVWDFFAICLRNSCCFCAQICSRSTWHVGVYSVSHDQLSAIFTCQLKFFWPWKWKITCVFILYVATCTVCRNSWLKVLKCIFKPSFTLCIGFVWEQRRCYYGSGWQTKWDESSGTGSCLPG